MGRRGVRHGVVLVGVVLATVASAGCGGRASSPADDGSRTFERQGFDITFRYPASLQEADDVVFGSAAGPPRGRTPRLLRRPSRYAYRVRLSSPSGAIGRLFVLFDRRVEYFFNCQSTPETRAELDGACDQALKTLERG